MKALLFVAALMSSAFAFADGRDGLPFQLRDGFGNHISGISQAGKKCQFNYLVDRYQNFPSATNINSWYEDTPNLLVGVAMPSQTFEDIFVTGDAFVPGYQLQPEALAEVVKLNVDPQTGNHLVVYEKSDEFNGATLKSTLQIQLNARLKPLRFTTRYQTKERGFLGRLRNIDQQDTCELDPKKVERPL